MSSWGLIVAVLALTTLLLVAGLGQLAADAADRAGIRRRNALAEAERRDRRLWTRLDAAFRRTQPGHDLETHLAGGGVSLRPLTFLVVAIGAALLTGRLVDTVLPWWLAVPAGLGAGWGCFRWVERLRSKRRDHFINQLPDVARLISNGSRAGLSLLSAIELAAGDLDDPAGEELELVASQIRLGQSLEAAMAAMVERMPSRDVGVLVSTLVIQQRAGGDVVEALSDLAETLESRRDTAREVRVMLVGAVFTSYVIPLLVVGLLVLLDLTSPGALDTLVGGAIGRVVLLIAGGMTALGYVLIRRITKVEL